MSCHCSVAQDTCAAQIPSESLRICLDEATFMEVTVTHSSQLLFAC